jgi:hypothetical protein
MMRLFLSRNQITHKVLLAAIAVQLLVSFVFTLRTSTYIADDLFAINLAYNSNFLDYIQKPIDVHRVPLHRAVNFLIHHLLPMNFAAATFFLLSCHVLAMLALYRLLQRLNNSAINIWLVAAYGLNAFVLIPLHWWSAGLHRFPCVLATITSCYCFVRCHQSNRYRDGMLGLLCAAIAIGFYIKGILIPLYWAAILFCIMDFREWRKSARQYVVLAAASLISLTYVAWYINNNTYNFIKSPNANDILRIGMQWGISIVAQMPLQMYFRTDYAPWINLAWLTVLAIFGFRVRNAWRPLMACIALIAINLLMIAASARSSTLGPLIMLEPRYYYEILFLLVIFTSLMCRNFSAPGFLSGISGNGSNSILRRTQPIWLIAILALYSAAGWRSVLLYTNPGPNENYWRCAEYERNLISGIHEIGVENLNLSEGTLPKYFLFDKYQPNPLPLSTYLAWHGLHPSFGQKDKPLHLVDDNGNLQPVITADLPQSTIP